MIIAITGYPGTGKTTAGARLAAACDGTIISTDSYRSYPWDDQPEVAIAEANDIAANIAEEGGDLIVEGVLVARMLRKGWTPDAVIVLTKRHRPRIAGHASIETQVDRALADYKGLVLRVSEVIL